MVPEMVKKVHDDNGNLSEATDIPVSRVAPKNDDVIHNSTELSPDGSGHSSLDKAIGPKVGIAMSDDTSPKGVHDAERE